MPIDFCLDSVFFPLSKKNEHPRDLFVSRGEEPLRISGTGLSTKTRSRRCESNRTEPNRTEPTRTDPELTVVPVGRFSSPVARRGTRLSHRHRLPHRAHLPRKEHKNVREFGASRRTPRIRIPRNAAQRSAARRSGWVVDGVPPLPSGEAQRHCAPSRSRRGSWGRGVHWDSDRFG